MGLTCSRKTTKNFSRKAASKKKKKKKNENLTVGRKTKLIVKKFLSTICILEIVEIAR